MEIKYNITIEDNVIKNRLVYLINQIFKLLPAREEGLDWEASLNTIVQELAGMQRLMEKYQELFFPLLNKLEGL